MNKKRRLGRGLGALIEEADVEEFRLATERTAPRTEGEVSLPVGKIVPNRFQPRRSFNPETIAEMAASIKAQGLIQPLVVNPRGDGTYELISGERRLRAVKRLGWQEVPGVLHKVTDEQLLEMTLVENLQREDLNPIEEALGYQCLVQKFSLTQAQIGEKVGKDRATVANTLRLLQLPEVVRQAVASGALTAGHARQILVLEDEAEQIELARRVVEKELSVRKLEALVRKIKADGVKDSGKTDKPVSEAGRLDLIADLEDKLRRTLGTQVRIRDGSGGRGKIEIEFYSYEEFERLMELLRIPLA